MVSNAVDIIRYGSRMAHTEEGWIQPLADAVRKVDHACATWRPAKGVASIWEILAHAIPYTESTLASLTGSPVEESPDWPKVTDTSEPAWEAMKSRAISACERLEETIAHISDEDLLSPPDGKKTPRARRVMEIAIHDAYHAGQIVKLTQAFAKV